MKTRRSGELTLVSRFEKKVNLREFKEYVTEVQMRADEQHQEKMLDDMA